MQTISEQLRQYALAMSDPTRALILSELGHAGELTATQLARRLGLTANNVYHHMRVLRRLGVVAPPRSVPGQTYVEKYYQIAPPIQSVLGLEPNWLDQTMATMTAEDRQVVLVSLCMMMAQLLQRAARRYQAMDAVELDKLAREQQLAMVSISEMSRVRFASCLDGLRHVLDREQEPLVGGDAVYSDVVLIAGLPLLWNNTVDGVEKEEHGEPLSEWSTDRRGS